MSPDRVAELTQEVDRLTRGLVGAHYHLAEQLHEADTTWLLYYLGNLLGGQTPERAAEQARNKAREVGAREER